MLTKMLVICVMIAAVTVAHATNYVKNVVVLNEGHYDYANQVQTVPVTIGSYDPITHVYGVFDTIFNARFATCVVVDTNFIYAAADSFLIKYDRFTHARLFTQTVQGIRKIAVWGNELLVSRGQYLVDYPSYFQVYDKIGLGFVYELDSTVGPRYASEGIVVDNNVAYIAINNAFHFGQDVGMIGKINLTTHAYIGNIDLGVNGIDPENIVFDGSIVYTVNNRDYSTGSVSAYNIATTGITTADLGTSSGCGASVLATAYIYYQVAGDTKLARFSTTTLTNVDTLNINKTVYGMVHDPVNGLIYAGETDYITSGTVFIYNLMGIAQDSFVVGVAPGNLAMDIRSNTGINTINNTMNIAIHPNPAGETVVCEFVGMNTSEIITLIITDVLGTEVMNVKGTAGTLHNININTLAKGVYGVSIITTKGIVTTKLVKE